MKYSSRALHALWFVAALAFATGAASVEPTIGIAWREAASDTDVDAAFAQARIEGKPLFMYWGAVWCPPCNQLKATLFNRADFIERSRAFVSVHIDGDDPGAQKLGARFKVRGYPTTLLFDSNGVELTRLPGAVDPQVYTQVLTLGMNSRRPVKDLLAAVRAGGAGLSENDWKLLAFYDWEAAEAPLVREVELPALLAQLARACPAAQTETAMRLRLKALAAAGAGRSPMPSQDPAALPAVLALLANEARARRYVDVLTGSAAELVRALAARGSAARRRLLPALDAALVRLADDPSLSRADRLSALYERIELAHIDAPLPDSSAAPRATQSPLPPDLLDAVRGQSARADREITDGDERQAVITTAAYVLDRAGLGEEADALLRANLSKSHSPYYLMSSLAAHARRRHDSAEALRWSEQAFEASAGTATRLQWGERHLEMLVELAPGDEGRIETHVARLWALAAQQSDAFHERSARSMQGVGARLLAWDRGGRHHAVVARLKARLDQICAALDPGDPQRAACLAVFAPPRGKPV